MFIPCIAPMVGTSMVWKYGIVGTDGGLLNRIMSNIWHGTEKLVSYYMADAWRLLLYIHCGQILGIMWCCLQQESKGRSESI